ncbi:L-2-amino-thiazoline-4-carboxylic acid hydrolase [Neisseriaceae bacterium ESL0693]|nr:L-2-amino-thiazoline-4-carboxylic acid hydrolase [Neisseriaceae bacterium ESL0693]
MPTFPEIGILHQRKIEAEIIKPIYDILVHNYGKQEAKAIIAEAIATAAVNAGKSFAAKEAKATSMESFVALQHLWEQDDALDITILKNDADHYHYNVHQCRYAQMYQEMGLEDIGFLLSCHRDSKFIEGYAPHITLERQHTVMMGDGLCDFRYQRQAKQNDQS